MNSYLKQSALDALEQLKVMQQESGEQNLLCESDSEIVVPDRESITEIITGLVIQVLKLPESEFSATTPLMDYGLDSIAATEIGNLFTSKFNITIPPTVFFEFNDLNSFIEYLFNHHHDELLAVSSKTSTSSATQEEVSEVKKSQSLPRTSNHEKSAIEPSMNLEALWQQAEKDHIEYEQQEQIVPAAKTDISSNIRPSQATLDSYRHYADEAVIHTVTRKEAPPLEYATYGTGKPLLMLGGLLMHYEVMWLTNIKDLGQKYRLIMFHMPGCGGLEPRESLSLSDLAQDINSVLDAEGIDNPIPVFGCSFGGVLAQAFVTAFPKRCSALAIAVSTPFAKGATDFQALMKELQSNSLFMELNRGWPMSALPLYEKVIGDFDYTSQLARLSMPALIIAGGQDKYTLPEYSKTMTANLSDAELVIIDDANHLLTFTHHQEFNHLLLSFLEKNEDKVAEEPKSKYQDSSIIRPVINKTIERLKMYVREGGYGHTISLSSTSAQLCVLIDRILSKKHDSSVSHRSYFLTSQEEALDAAIRFARHQARNKNSDSSDGHVLISNDDGFWEQYFNPNLSDQSALVPGISFNDASIIATEQYNNTNTVCSVFICQRSTSNAEVESWLEATKKHKLSSILVDNNSGDALSWIGPKVSKLVDILVIGESIANYQAPISALVINKSIDNPWLMTPNEGYIRQPMANFGATISLAFEYLFDLFSDELTHQDRQLIRLIDLDDDIRYQMHVEHGNIGYAKVASMHGYDAKFYDGYGLSARVKLPNRMPHDIIDCLNNVGTAPRGLNPQDIIPDVLETHKSDIDYWEKLCNKLRELTGLTQFFPANSQTAAIETALTLTRLAVDVDKKMVFFTGGAGFSLLSANTAKDMMFDIFRGPFQPLSDNCVYIDTSHPSAIDKLKVLIEEGNIGSIWLETIQVEGNAVRPLPEAIINIVNENKQDYGYLVIVDETQTNLATGKVLHSDGLVDSPDIVLLGTALTDSLFPYSAVMTLDDVAEKATLRNQTRYHQLKTRHLDQISSHLALHSLNKLVEPTMLASIRKKGDYLKNSLQKLVDKYPLLRDVRGQGLILAIELNLDGYPDFIKQSFGYFFWGAMLRDMEGGVAAVVCPIHNHSLRIMPPLIITEVEIEKIVANIKRRLEQGVEIIIRDAASYVRERGDARTSDFLNSLIESAA
nr:aminotransferase class III-fold pyridoxal phosphate-dependent enzyme [uncultured Methylophaga sp.]